MNDWREMSKYVKKTYGKKVGWESGASNAFDEAKLHSLKTNPGKIIRPSIWAKVPLIETFTAESPPKPKKKAPPAAPQGLPEAENEVRIPKKGKKRKFRDPFGFGDFDDEVLPASEYISPKKKMALEKPKKKSKPKKVKTGIASKKSPLEISNGSSKKVMQQENNQTSTPRMPDALSPKKRGRPFKNSMSSPMAKSSGVDTTQSPRKRGRPPKNSTLSPVIKSTELKETSSPRNRGRTPKNTTILSIAKSNGVKPSQSPKGRGRSAKNSGLSPMTESSDVDTIPSPKKRGRPPKKLTASPMTPSEDGEVTASNSSQSPKKRGRPPKNLTASPMTPSEDGEVTASNSSQSPKKRGRPPKNLTASSMAPSEDGEVTANNSSQSPKKRGRPPKNLTASPMTPTEDGEVTASNSSQSPKKRGRPPKYGKQSPTSPLRKPTQIAMPDEAGFSPSPKKRGRPPKNQDSSASGPVKVASKLIKENSINAIPKKRGAPPQSPNLLPSNAIKVKELEKGSMGDSKINNSSPRKRGRPPKNPTSCSTDGTENLGSSQDSTVMFESPMQDRLERSPKDLQSKSDNNYSDSMEENVAKDEADDVISDMTNSPVIEEPIVQTLSSQAGDSSVSPESVIQVIDGAPLIKRKRGKQPKAKRPVKHKNNDSTSSQEANILSEKASLTSPQVLTQSTSTDNTEPSRSELDADSLADQALYGEKTKRVRFSTDNSQTDIDSETFSGRASTSSASGSPFKWFLKNNEKTLSPKKVAQFRRMSVLPTCTPQKEDDDDENDGELAAIPFSLSWAMQQDDNAVRVKHDDKELFTIVRNTKQAQESVEFGESQQFKDDIEYLLDGISDTNSLSTRCLSLIELASKCSKSAFRMNLRAHGTVTAIFERINDSPTNQNLALCTALVMFMLTRDRLSIDFDKSILEIMLKLLAIEDQSDEKPSKEWDRLTTKIRAIFEKNEVKGVNNLDLSKLTTESLARESFLSLTLQRTGSWFKDEIRLLGGLDHVVDRVVSCSKCLKVNVTANSSDSATNVRQIERCFKLLENVTVQCPSNQGYLISYRDSALLETCSRLLKFCFTSLIDGPCENQNAVQALWFSTMKILLNLTHDNELASTRFCQQNNVLSILLKSALQLPRYLPLAKQFDVIVLSLGLLINVVEYSKKNLMALNAAMVPSLQTSNQDENTVYSERDDTTAVEALMHLFMVKLEAAKDNSGMEEDLAKLNSSLHNSSIRIGSDGISVVCGDDLDKSENDENTEGNEKEAEENKADEKEVVDKAATEKSETKTSAEKEAEHLGKALQKAGQHMEDSLIASYAALLVGLLCEDSKENQQIIHDKLLYGDFGIMTHTLDKFLAFMNMTASSSSSSSSLVIKRAIKILEECKSEYPTSLPVTQTAS